MKHFRYFTKACFDFFFMENWLAQRWDHHKSNFPSMQQSSNDITTHPWYNSYFTSISACGMWGVKADVQFSKK